MFGDREKTKMDMGMAELKITARDMGRLYHDQKYDVVRGVLRLSVEGGRPRSVVANQSGGAESSGSDPLTH